jgi:Mrp family chromosome partitioning ATPase
MSEQCNHDCGSCSQDCAERDSLLAKANEQSHVKQVIGVVSGKGGVGKSLVTGLLASYMQQKGLRVGILDADITGPSVPKMFGVTEKAGAVGETLLPVQTQTGIKLMSINLLLESDTDPVIWRGPLIAGAVKQFWTDVAWGDLDVLFVDMPPGTGDVPLTVFQSLPLDGIFIVTSPQELVSMIVSKAVNMATDMNVPVLGIVENMSYLKCPDCGKELEVFGKSHTKEAADRFGLPVLSRVPIDPKLASLCDKGEIEYFTGAYIEDAAEKLLK